MIRNFKLISHHSLSYILTSTLPFQGLSEIINKAAKWEGTCPHMQDDILLSFFSFFFFDILLSLGLDLYYFMDNWTTTYHFYIPLCIVRLFSHKNIKWRWSFTNNAVYWQEAYLLEGSTEPQIIFSGRKVMSSREKHSISWRLFQSLRILDW